MTSTIPFRRGAAKRRARPTIFPRYAVHALTLVSAAVLLLSGCANRSLTQLSSPKFQMPARFSASGNAPRPSRWWRSFDDPGLNQLVEQALGHNFSLQAGYARVKRARALVNSANANLYPTVSGSVSQSATRRPKSSISSAASSGAALTSRNGSISRLPIGKGNRKNWRTSRSAQVNVNYNLDIWGKYRDRKQAAIYSLRVQRQTLKAASMTTAGDIASDWYKFLELRAKVRLLKRQLKVNKDILRLTHYSFNNGQSSAAAVLRQRETVASSKGQLAKTRSQKQAMRHALAVLVGQPPKSFQPPNGHLVSLPPLPKTGVPARLMMRRPDVREAFFQIASDNKSVAAALANRYPDVSLSATLNSAANPGSILSHWVTQLMGTLTQTIFDGGAKSAQVQKNRAQVDVDVANYQSKMLKALKQVENALTRERHQKIYIKHLNRQLALSKKTVANLRLRYLRGATNYFNVLNAVINRQNLQTSKLTARFNLLQYRINLYRALAGGVPVSSIGHRATDKKQSQSDQ